MGRRRIYQHHNIPSSVTGMVYALIRDYPRRKRIVEYSSASTDRSVLECVRLNDIVDSCIDKDEAILGAIIIQDIINQRGYDQSYASVYSSKKKYYNVKNKIIEDIAISCDWI
jgi:hypothetical protein